MSDDDPSDRADPFDRLDPDAERDGDPFERLGDESSGEEGDQDRRDSPTEDVWNEPGPAEVPSKDSDTPPAGADAADAVDSAGPLRGAGSGDPFANVDTPTESPFDGAGSVFERVDSGGVDPDQVWESIAAEDDGDDDGDDAEPSVPDEGRYSDVSKHTFCEQCEHFSPPPDVSCGHHTAEIIEFLDMETVRLLDCPVVAERRELERHD